VNKFAEGQEAGKAGKLYGDNPYFNGFTKLGSPKFGEGADEWEAGRCNAYTRWATKKELADAEAMDISKFRRKSNRYYR
jgi:hypothetical protein